MELHNLLSSFPLLVKKTHKNFGLLILSAEINVTGTAFDVHYKWETIT